MGVRLLGRAILGRRPLITILWERIRLLCKIGFGAVRKVPSEVSTLVRSINAPIGVPVKSVPLCILYVCAEFELLE